MSDKQTFQEGGQSPLDHDAKNEKLQDSNSDNSDRTIEDLEIGKIRSESALSAETEDGDEMPSLSQAPTRNSVPASVLSHPQSGADLEKGPTGPKNMTTDE